jgi:hypothetical protein
MQLNTLSRFVPTGYLAHIQLTGDANTYTTGGFLVGLAPFQFVDSIDDCILVEQSGLYAVEWVPATNALRVLVDPGTGLAEVANGGSTAGLVVDIYAFGR